MPRAIRRKALRQAPLALVLGGLLFGGFGVPFVWIFFPHRVLDEVHLNAGARTAPGAVVVAVHETNMKENDHPVLRYEFTFSTSAGVPMTGTCYRTGTAFDAGQRVTVEYLAGRPSVARIEGCRLSPFGWGGGFVIIFPLVGFGMMGFGLRSRRRIVGLLTGGLFSAGRITAVDATNVSVNKQQQYRVTVSFRAGGGDVETSYHAYGDDADLALRKKESGDTVGILYDAADPRRVLLVDTLVR